MVNDNKPKITVDDIVRYSSFQLGSTELETSSKKDGAHFASGAFRTYLEDRLRGQDDKTRSLVMEVMGPIAGRMAMEAQKGALSSTSEENFNSYFANSRAQLEAADVKTIVEGVQKVGYVGEVPDSLLNQHGSKTYEAFHNEVEGIVDKNTTGTGKDKKFDPESLTGDDKDTYYAKEALDVLIQNMNPHAKARTNDVGISQYIANLGKEKK
tara:strand:- start:2725 stop:3357 length:633 start_codon:yes stop_codon:yes gene_type:complete